MIFLETNLSINRHLIGGGLQFAEFVKYNHRFVATEGMWKAELPLISFSTPK